MQFHKNFYLQHKWQQLIAEHDATDLHAQYECSKHALVWAPDNDPHNHGVTIVKQGKHAHYHGLMTCGGVWGCPVCAAAALENYYYKIMAATNGMIANGYRAAMITFTIPHRQQQSAKAVLANLNAVMANFQNQRDYLADCKSAGFGGNIRALEATYGNNGWHWHFHVVAFFKDLTPAEAADLEQRWQRRWYESCLRIIPELIPYYPTVDELIANTDSDGVHFSRRRSGAIWLADDAETAAKYICNAAKELSAQHHKGKFTGHGSGWHVTPLQLLQSDEEHFNNMYFEYVRAAKGKYRIYISPYVRRRCGVDVNAEAERLHAANAENFTRPEAVCTFGVISWSDVVRVEHEQNVPLRAIILVQALNGGAGAVIRLCNRFNIDTSDISVPAEAELVATATTAS